MSPLTAHGAKTGRQADMRTVCESNSVANPQSMHCRPLTCALHSETHGAHRGVFSISVAAPHVICMHWQVRQGAGKDN